MARHLGQGELLFFWFMFRVGLIERGHPSVFLGLSGGVHQRISTCLSDAASRLALIGRGNPVVLAEQISGSLKDELAALVPALGPLLDRLCADLRALAADIAASADPRSETIRLCLAEVDAVFGSLAAFVELSYSHVGGPPAFFIRPDLYTAPCERGDVRSFSHTAGFDASFDVNGPAGPYLLLGVGENGPSGAQVMYLPYVLCHELVCHAYQAANSRVRENAPASCPWTEGWMDYVACGMLSRWLDDVPASLWTAPHRAQVDAATVTLSQLRRGPLPGLSAESVRRRQFGFETAGRLEHAYRLSGATSPFERLRAFSLRLNKADARPTQLEAIALRMGPALEFRGRVQTLSVAACSHFTDHGSLPKLESDLERAVAS